MRPYLVVLIVSVSLLLGCATTGRTRIVLGVGMGGAIGAAGGGAFSPNDESRGLNALVFGLAGAVAGGLVGLMSDPTPPPSDGKMSLRERDLGVSPSANSFVVPPDQGLPGFVRQRLQPLVIEESIQQDTVTEEGTLHEPHRVYRIKRMPELYSNPVKLNPELGGR